MAIRREVLGLVVLVLVVDAIFAAAYFLAGVARAADGTKLLFTAVWTVVTLVVVVRGLGRIRRARVRPTPPG